MRASLFLCLMLCGTLVSVSEANWFTDTVKNVTNAVKNVGKWVRNNCSGSVRFPLGVGVSCNFNGRKRDLDEKTRRKLDTACDEIDENPLARDGGFSGELVESIFKESDGDKDGVLNDNEYKHFETSLDIFYYCLDKDGQP